MVFSWFLLLIHVLAKIAEVIPSTINHLLYLTTNQNQQRVIRLTPGRGILPKTPYFARAKKEYDIDKGLVEYFMLGEQ
jgi:hypothetical protein